MDIRVCILKYNYVMLCLCGNVYPNVLLCACVRIQYTHTKTFSFVQIRGYINHYDFTDIFIRIWLENGVVLK